MSEYISNSVCRSCLEPTSKKKYPLIGQLVNVEIDVVSMLEFCTSSKLDISDDLPNSVCVCCFKTIRIAYRFLKQFYEVQTKLIALRNNKIVKSQDNEEHNDDFTCINADESSEIQDFISIHNYADHSQNENENNIEINELIEIENADNIEVDEQEEYENYEQIDELENHEEMDEMENNEDTFEGQEKCSIKLEVEDEGSENVQFINGENPDLVELLNLDATNIEVVVDNDTKLEKSEKIYRYICPICEKKFWRVESFYSHVSNYNLSKIKCTRCNLQPELDIQEYFQHYMDYHKFHCEICGKVMSSNYGYQYHIKHHENVRNFKCPVDGCNRSFLMNHLLKKHIKSHIEKNTHSCKFCEATFNTHDSLRYHLKLHFGKKDHLCTECGQAFYQAVHLRDHMYRHMGLKKFICDICGKGFITNGSLKKHILYCSKKHSMTLDNSEIVQIKV